MPEILGSIFAVFLMMFAYITFSFSDHLINSQYFSLLTDRIAKGKINLLPVTVVVAIILFVLREAFDLFKKHSERKRNIQAIKLLIADEIEMNHWSLVSMFRILSSLKEDFEENEDAVHYLHVARNGSEHFRSKEHPDDEYSSGQAIPKFYTAMYERLLPDIAALDRKLFLSVHSTYEQIMELIHYRDTMIDYLTGEELAPEPGLTRHFLSDLADEKDDYYQYLNETYRLIQNKDLTNWKLR